MPPNPQESRAVLIGTSRYTDPSWHDRQLPAVGANLAELAAIVRDDALWGLPDEHCAVVHGPLTPAELIGPIRRAAADATDTLLVYYAGHGFLAGRGDAELQLTLAGSADGDEVGAVNYNLFRNAVLDTRARRRIVVLDCCFAGSAVHTMGQAADQAPIAGAYVLAAVPPYRLAIAPRGAVYTAFTGELVSLLREGISDAGPELKLDDIYQHLWSRLAARNLPTPCRSDMGRVGGLGLVRNRYANRSAAGDILAVDFGTSNTTAVLRLASGALNQLLFDNSVVLPSAVCVAPDGHLLVGRDAVHSARANPAAFEPTPKRHIDRATLPLEGHDVTVLDAVAAVLTRVATEAGRRLGTRPERLVLTHPHSWGAQRRSVLDAAAVKAGLPKPELVSEPMAAAAYFTALRNHRVEQGQIVVLYDFGGGTFDVSTVRRSGDEWQVLRCAGLDTIGGVNLDEEVLHWIGEQVNALDPVAWQRMAAPVTADDRGLRHHLAEDARLAKERLSEVTTVDIPVPVVDRDITLTRRQFECLVRRWIQQTVRLTASTVAASDAGPDQIAGIILIGGSSRIPLVREMLEQATGISPKALPDPELVVAEGALHRLAAVQPPPERHKVPPDPRVRGPAPGPTLAEALRRHSRSRWNIASAASFGLLAGVTAGLTAHPTGSEPMAATVAGGVVAGLMYVVNLVLAALQAKGSEHPGRR